MIDNLQHEEEFDVQNLLKKVKQYRWLFLSSVIICLLVTFFYHRYTVPVYNVKASILIDEEENMSETAELIYGTDLLSSNKSLYNEIAILKSFPFIYRTIKALDRRVTYFKEGRVEDGELYTDVPFLVRIDSIHYSPQNEDIPFYVTMLDDQRFLLEASWGEQVAIEKELPFEQPFLINGTNLTLHRKQLPERVGGRFYFVINDFEKLARTYKNSLSIYPYSKESSVIDISLETSVPQKEIDFLNELTHQYTIVSLEDKNQSTSQSLSFIDEQLAKTFDTLQVIEKTLENFKSSSGFSQTSGMLDRSFDKISELESEKAVLLVNDKYYQAIQQYLEENRSLNELVAPSSLGVQDVLLNSLISQLATLQIEKNTFLIEGSAKNPYLKEIEGKINNTKATLQESLQNMIASNQLSLSQINRRIAVVEKEISALPKTERKYITIKRVYDLNENIYNLLLQKKVEAGITQASATVDNKVIEPAYLESVYPVKPNKLKNFLIAIIIGLILSSAFIFMKDLLNTKVKTKDDIKQLTDIPVIGTIHKNENDNFLVCSKNPKSATAESFRVLRSNLKFTNTSQGANSVYLVTSSISGEGKTFCSINLATALAFSGKKTLFLDADMRKEEDLSDFKMEKGAKGLSNYLAKDATLDEIIQLSGIDNLQVIPSGPIPPNPSELLMTESMELLVDVLVSSFDYIVIDTPPVGLVTDAQILMKYSNTNLHIIRQGFTQKETVKQVEESKAQGLLTNIHIIYNDVKGRLGYYGYGYYKKPIKKATLKMKLRMLF